VVATRADNYLDEQERRSIPGEGGLTGAVEIKVKNLNQFWTVRR
jgi:hypothetical protein